MGNVKPSTMFTGDNLPILRGMDSETVNLVYLDPPFNSKKMWNAPMGSKAAGVAFKDTWTSSDIDKDEVSILERDYSHIFTLIDAIGSINGKADMSYLLMMASRLIELHRILKPTGSIFLHCDPTMSHGLRLLMDAIFSSRNFLAEITWKRYAPHSISRSCVDTISDKILYYAKDSNQVYANTVVRQLSATEFQKSFCHIEEETGRRYQHVSLEYVSNHTSASEIRRFGKREVVSNSGWRWSQKALDEQLFSNPHVIHWTDTGRPRFKIYADEYQGSPVGNIWTDIDYLSSRSKERVNVGYPTQKPLALLRRILKAGSKENELVLEPFCGCATACIAAQEMNRKWIGIDISKKAVEVALSRFEEELLILKSRIIERSDVPIRTSDSEALI